MYMTTLLLSDYMTVNDFSIDDDNICAPNMQENMLPFLYEIKH